MAPKGRPKKKVEIAEEKLAVNDVVADEVIKVKKAPKKGGGKELQGNDVANGVNGSGETGEPQAESVSGTDAPANDKTASKRQRKPAKVKVPEESAEEEKKEESSDVKVDDKPKDLPAKRGRKAAKNENGDAKDKEEDDEAETVVQVKDLPKSRRNVKAVVESSISEKEQNKVEPKETKAKAGDEAETVVQVKDLPRSRRNVKADVESSTSEKEQNKLEPKETKAKAGKRAKAQVKENSVEKEVSVKLPGRKRKNAEKSEPEKVEEEKPSEVDNKPQLRVALKRNRNLDEMARQQRENDAEDFEEPKVKNVKGPGKGKGKRAAKDTSEDLQPTKKTKEETKSKGAPKKDKIPDVTALDFTNESKTKEGKPWNLKIATWNVNGVRAWLEKNGISYLHHEKPDIMCIQETKCSDDKLPPEVVNIDGYHCHWLAGDKEGYSGVGLLSKKKPISVQYGIEIEEHDNEGRVITAEYDEFYLVTTYIPNAGRGLIRLDYRQKWDEDFRAYIKKLDEKKPVILCGDLNVAHEEIDLANPKSNKKNAGFTKEEREGFSTLLSEGFVDTFRHLYPDKTGAYTFWTYMMNARAKNVGWRLDYFVISERFSDHLCDNVIRSDVFGSDHCPIALFLHV